MAYASQMFRASSSCDCAFLCTIPTGSLPIQVAGIMLSEILELPYMKGMND